MITQRDPEVEEPVQEDLYRIGTIAEIKQLVKTKNNMIQVLVEGKERAELLRFEENTNYLDAEIALFQEEHAEDMDENLKEAMIRGMKELFIRYCNENPKLSKDLANQILEQEEVQKVIDQIAVNLPMRYEDKQKILDAVTLEERYEVLGMILSHEIEIMQIRVDLNQKSKAAGGQESERLYFKRTVKGYQGRTGRPGYCFRGRSVQRTGRKTESF